MKKFSIFSFCTLFVWHPKRASQRRLVFLFLLLLLSWSQGRAQCPAVFTTGCIWGQDVHTFTMPGDGTTSISSPSSSCAPGFWADYTNDSVTLTPGSTYTATINTQGIGVNVQVFIDFNDDGDFSATETVGGMNSMPFEPATATFSVAVPAGSATGAHFMRVIASGDVSYPFILGCVVPPTIFGSGEAHDYVAVVGALSTPSCAAVTGLTAGSITSTSAAISWTAATGSVGYKYVVNTTAAAPAVAGSFTTGTTYGATGLTPSTTYYAHVRDTCGPGSVSAWSTYSFTTTSTSGCGAVTGLTASGVINTSATVSWTGVAGSVGYQYVVNTTATPPVTPGTAVTGTSISPSGLTPSTVYYAHVRNSCGTASFSAWVTISFTTTATAPSCLPVTGATSSGITSTSATVSWTLMTGSVRYKYVVNTTAADPTVPGTATTLNSFVATGLSGGTTYFAHVRDSCGPGNVSSWVTVSFTTPGTSFINDIVSGKDAFISVFPNPVTGTATLKVNGLVHGDAHLQLLDMEGRVLKVIDMNAGTGAIDMSAMAAGIYICKYIDSEMTTTARILKR